MDKLLIITGTTATGKTKRAIALAKELGGELISADSRQVYKHLDIITGKDFNNDNWLQVETLSGFDLGYYTIEGVRVWLYDILDPRAFFSAYDWVLCARRAIELILSKGKVPIVVGGSYFYIQTLLYGQLEVGVSANWELRRSLEPLTVPALQLKLRQKSEQTFNRLNFSDRQNKRRLIRWLEKLNQSSVVEPLPAAANEYRTEIIGLEYKNKDQFREKIVERVEKRLTQGALEEMELLLRMGYRESDPGLQTIGYKELFLYLKEGLPLEEAKKRWIVKEVQYAKRQLTFMKKNPNIKWEIM